LRDLTEAYETTNSLLLIATNLTMEALDGGKEPLRKWLKHRDGAISITQPFVPIRILVLTTIIGRLMPKE